MVAPNEVRMHVLRMWKVCDCSSAPSLLAIRPPAMSQTMAIPSAYRQR